MADIFLSYANENRATAETVARGLEASGLTVWWDRNLHGGSDFSTEIGRQLAAARAAVVLWSRHSIESEWVRDEAAEARDAGKLVPACIDESRPPLGFRQRQAIDLKLWNGDPAAPQFAELVRSAFTVIGEERKPVAARPRAFASLGAWARRRAAIIGAAALTVAAAALAGTAQFGAKPHGIAVEKVRPLTEDAAAFAEGLSAALLREFAEAGVDAAANRKRPEFRLNSAVGKEGEKLVVDLAAENAAGRVLWSQRLRQAEMKPGAFQDFAASRGAGAMTCSLKKRAQAGGKMNEDQFGFLLAVCAAWNSDDLAARYAAATQLLRAAPNLALAHAEMAAAAGPMSMAARSASERKKYQDQRTDEARKALAIDPKYGLAHTVLGHGYRTDGDLVRAMEHWEKGLEYSQDEPGPYMTMEWQLREVGRVDSSIDVIERAIGRFPDDPYFLDALAGAYSMKGWHDDVTDALARASALDPKRASRAATFIMWEKLISGAPEEALEALAGLKAANEIPRDDVCFATFVEARGAAAAGESVSDKIAVMKANCISKFWQARMYAALGDADGALENLKLYYDAPEWRSRTILFDPEMRRLRADPRFWELAVKLGLVDYWTSTDNWPDFCADPQYPVDCKALGQAAAKSTGSSARKP